MIICKLYFDNERIIHTLAKTMPVIIKPYMVLDEPKAQIQEHSAATVKLARPH